MSLLSHLREAPRAEQAPRRWQMVMDADPTVGAPALRVEVEYCDDDDWVLMSRKYRPRGSEVPLGPFWIKELTSDKRNELIAAFFKRYLKNMTGVCKENLPRFCPKAMNNVKLLESLPEGEIPFDAELRDDLAVLCTTDFFFGVWGAATNLQDFGAEVQAKND